MVITSAERARDLKGKPVIDQGGSAGHQPGQQIMTSLYRDDITGLPEMGLVARQLWQQSGLTPADIQTAVIYDHFTPFVLQQLEEFGFCPRGEAKDFVRAGHHARGGRLPINTHGGQLGEAYIHGMNGIAEGVRQVRGTRGQPGGRGAKRAGHRRHRRADQRADSRRRLTAQTDRDLHDVRRPDPRTARAAPARCATTSAH
jgi:acetyl-CoA acetyltransferase